MREHPVPKVGDTVRLNDEGLEVCFGSVVGLAHMKTLDMKITFVDSESMTEPEETFVVQVDNEGINRFLISHWCFDIVASPGECRIETEKECGCGLGQCNRGLIY